VNNPFMILLLIVSALLLGCEQDQTASSGYPEEEHSNPVVKKTCTEPSNPYNDGGGHDAGFNWAMENGRSCSSNSNSFDEGCDGDASLIWSGVPSSAEVVFRFLEIHGVGPKIATMAFNILARNFKVKFKDYYSIDISADVHIKRVFHRLGLTSKSASTEEVIYKARALHPEFPGVLDFPCWEIGRSWCRPQKPTCEECYMGEVCPSKS
jgi:hypothetical protein